MRRRSHRKRWKWNQQSYLRLSFNETVFDDAYFVSTFSCYRSGLFTEKLPLVLNEQPPTRGPAEPRTNSGNNFPGSKIPVKVDREVCSTFSLSWTGISGFGGKEGPESGRTWTKKGRSQVPSWKLDLDPRESPSHGSKADLCITLSGAWQCLRHCRNLLIIVAHGHFTIILVKGHYPKYGNAFRQR